MVSSSFFFYQIPDAPRIGALNWYQS
jgi:hypothetical protein